ncbi:uncharacterized protein LOC126728943 isoform X2 [Quercus robur]|uniref:uncharacterized protein LOC126728943 isoform X2 n=1 Tax=Quercus robur TaxID=38942 RepID=UPI002162EA43|nr:uncharacterized protein LOC126728943 isoform X2 [Quercus robur]XP_050290664.1 uncharacterized protein LOC126728943 isoform X2 [Quercus robur]
MPKASMRVESALPSPDQAPVMLAAPALPSSSVTQPLAPSSHPDMEGDFAAFALPLPAGVTGETESPILFNGSRRHQWENRNRFFPLSELGNEMGSDQIIKSKALGGFDFAKKSCKAHVSIASRPVRVSHLKWTQAYFNLKILVDWLGEGKRAVYWGNTQPNVSRHSQAQAHHTSSSENGKGQYMIVLPDNITRSFGWDAGEGSGTHEEEEGVIPSSGEGSGCPPVATMNPKVGLDFSFHVTEVGGGLSESSDKGEADSVDITPLALWDPYYVSDLAPLEDDSDVSSMEEELEPSEWVRTMIKGFGTFVGFPIACCERQCIDFF